MRGGLSGTIGLMEVTMSDGIPLTSMAHPVPVWWKRLLFLFRWRRELRSSALETVEIEIKPALAPMWERATQGVQSISYDSKFMPYAVQVQLILPGTDADIASLSQYLRNWRPQPIEGDKVQ